MKPEKNYTEELNRLIESLSDFSSENLEDAKAIIRLSGKDPDRILSEIKKKLYEIQINTKIKRIKSLQKNMMAGKGILSTYPVLQFDEDEKKVQLTFESSSSGLLNADEVYSTFIKRLPLRNILPVDLKIDETVSNVKFLKITAELFFEIRIASTTAIAQPFLRNMSKNFYLDIDQVRMAITTGYFIAIDTSQYGTQHIWMSIDKESIEWSKKMLENMDGNDELPVNKALWFYARKEQYRWLQFPEGTFNLQEIFNSDYFLGDSRLFVRTLYDYQKNGLIWLKYCCINRTGGILADDMGLGKTAQAIALIAWLIENKVVENILLVVPGTLIENWRREFQFFSPAITPLIHHGSNRTGLSDELKKYQVVLSSYSTIVNDRYLFNKINWGLILCDEASLIKNPDSERRISLNDISSEIRITMTGTPVENSLLDLWSLVDFVNPGLLGTRSEFSGKYIRSDITETLQKTDLPHLRQYLSLIMLRRKKEDVLDSLPERIDIHQALEMTKEESILYDNQRQLILSKIDVNKGANILLEIMELRKFTTHPYLLDKEKLESCNINELKNSSVKFSRTIELLDEIQERKEKALIFSEYLNMIDLLKEKLSKHYHIPVFTIDGRIPTEDRQKYIDKFTQQEGFGLMVLNPRTAGLGLNITAANHVIHYTRQWNPALEEQASSRSYRNQQKKCVNIYYLYYVNTIEEIIDERLKSKMSLSREVIMSSDKFTNDDCIEILNKSPLK